MEGPMKYPGITFTFIFFTLINCSLFSQSWIQQTTNTNESVKYIDFIDVNTGFAGCSNGIILKTTNSGTNWLIINTGFNVNFISIKIFSINNIVAAGEKIIRSTNGGLNWTVIYDSSYANDISYLDLNRWFVSANSPHSNILTTNGGVTWSSFNYSDFTQPSVFFINDNTGWISGKFVTGSLIPSHISKTTDKGLHWTTQYSQMSINNNAWIYDILFNDLTRGFALYWDFFETDILSTTNGGLNWTGLGTPAIKQRNIYFVNFNNGWTCGDNGIIYITSNNGVNWNQYTIPGNYLLNSIHFVNTLTGWTCGNNGIILKSTNGGVLTGLINTGNPLPEKYSLSQNYPNPFNPITNIKFDIPETGFTRLEIYDALGRNVSTLIEKTLDPGSYSYDWDASNYPSGVYFYKLETGNYKSTKKMVLIK